MTLTDSRFSPNIHFLDSAFDAPRPSLLLPGNISSNMMTLLPNHRGSSSCFCASVHSNLPCPPLSVPRLTLRPSHEYTFLDLSMIASLLPCGLNLKKGGTEEMLFENFAEAIIKVCENIQDNRVRKWIQDLVGRAT